MINLCKYIMEDKVSVFLKLLSNHTEDDRIPLILTQHGDMTIDDYVNRLIHYGKFEDEIYFAVTMLLTIKNRYLITHKTILRIFGTFCFAAFIHDNSTERVQRQCDRLLELICLTPDELYDILNIDFGFDNIYDFTNCKYTLDPYNATKLIIETRSPLLISLINELWINKRGDGLNVYDTNNIYFLSNPDMRFFLYTVLPRLIDDFDRIWFEYESILRIEAYEILRNYLGTRNHITEECISMVPLDTSMNIVGTCRSISKCLHDADKFKTYLMQQINKSTYQSSISVYTIMRRSFKDYDMDPCNQIPLNPIYGRRKILVLVFLWNGSLIDQDKFDAVPLYLINMYRTNKTYNTHKIPPTEYHNMLLSKVPKIYDYARSIDDIVEFNLTFIQTIHKIYIHNSRETEITLEKLFQHKELEHYKTIIDNTGLKLGQSVIKDFDRIIVKVRYYYLKIINFAYVYKDFKSQEPHTIMNFFDLYDIVDNNEDNSIVHDVARLLDLPFKPTQYNKIYRDKFIKIDAPDIVSLIYNKPVQCEQYLYKNDNDVYSMMVTCTSGFKDIYKYENSRLDPLYFIEIYGFVSFGPDQSLRLVTRYGVPFNSSEYKVTRNNIQEFLGILEYLKYKKLSVHPAYLNFDNVLVYPPGQLVFGLVRMEETTDTEPLFDFLLELETRCFVITNLINSN